MATEKKNKKRRTKLNPRKCVPWIAGPFCGYVGWLVLLPWLPAIISWTYFGLDNIPLHMWPSNVFGLVMYHGPQTRRAIGSTRFANSSLYAPYTVTEEQRAHYFEHGWVLLPGVLPPDVLTELRAVLLKVGIPLWPWSINTHFMIDEVLDFYLFSNLGDIMSQFMGNQSVHLPVFCCVLFWVALQYTGSRQREWCTRDYFNTDCHDEKGINATSSTNTGLKVVLPSFGQTGTSSVTQALRELGLRAYHADDFSVLAKPVMFDAVKWDLWAQTVSRCRMEAISLEPVTDMVPIAVAKSPDAKFVLTWRNYNSWVASTKTSRMKEIRLETVSLLFTKANGAIPWLETFDRLTGVIDRHRRMGNPFYGEQLTVFHYLYRLMCNGYGWPITKYTKRGAYWCRGQEEAYLGHMNEIRTLVPKERLLEFDVKKHGWDELEMFLFGNKSSTPRGPFPNPRQAGMRTNEPLVENNPRTSIPAFMIYAFLHALNYCIFSCLVMVVVDRISRTWRESLAVFVRLRGPVAPRAPSGSRRGLLFDAFAESPAMAVLQGVGPEEVAETGKAICSAGFQVLAVPLDSPGALQSLELLTKTLPQGTFVGATSVNEASDVEAVSKAGGCFVVSHILDPLVVQHAACLGLKCFPGFYTPTEAATAMRQGASGLHIFPSSLLAPESVQAYQAALPSKTCLILADADTLSSDDLRRHWAAGVRCFGAGQSLFRSGKTPDAIGAKARSFLKICTEVTK